MFPKVIKTEADYESALKRIGELMEAEPGTPDGEELELLATLVEIYEDQHFPVGLPSPVEAIEFRMDQAGLTRKDLIPYIGSRSKVSEVLNGKRPLSLRMIRALHKGLGIPAEVLLQKLGESIPEEDSGIDWSRFSINEMYKRNWFPRFSGTLSEAKEHAEELLREFFEVLEPGELGTAMYRMRVRSGSEADRYSLLAWGARVLILARENSLPAYKPGSVNKGFARDLAKVSYFDEGPKLAKEYIEKHGVHMIVERHLPRTHLDGAAMRLPDGAPVVALTLRHDRLDNFWFCLFHELAHVALHFDAMERDCFLDDLDTADGSKQEEQADRWAADALISPKIWREASLRKSADTLSVREMAENLRIHPAIIAGRIRKERNNYKILYSLVGNRTVRKQFL